MIIDGRAIAKDILMHTQERASRLRRPPRVLALVANDTPATRSYLAIKEKRAADAGCAFAVERFPEAATTEEFIRAVMTSEADALIVQLPLPATVNTVQVLDAIPQEKDADVLSRAARSGTLLPPVVGAMAEIIERSGVRPAGKRAVVIGSGWLVGEPAAQWLRTEGAAVRVLTKGSADFAEELRSADLIISGAGSAGIIRPEMLKEGAVLIDAGTSESNGEVVGDAEPSCAQRCAVFTPVPGGMGPIAVAKLFENAVALSENKINP